MLESRILLAAPVANDDSYSVAANGYLSEWSPGVLGNDTDADLDSLTATLVSATSNGSLTLNSDGSFSYMPNSSYNGVDTFTYKAWDGSSYSNVATVSITVGTGGGGGGNSAPFAFDDSYTLSLDELDTSAASLSTVLANDTDGDSDPLTAVLVTNASHGTVTLSSNGHFVYTPDLGYFGNDSFTYKADDGTDQSGAATVTIEVKKTFGNRSNLDDRPSAAPSEMGDFAVSYHTGDAVLTHAVAPGHALHYSALTHEDPVVYVETAMDMMAATPSLIEAKLTFDGVTGDSVFYSTSGLMGAATIGFTLAADGSTLDTGRYDYELHVIAHYSGGTATNVYTGTVEYVRRDESEFGLGWNLAELDRLVFQTGGVLLVEGDGPTGWFEEDGGGGFNSPPGPLNPSTLVENVDGSYTLTDKHGNERHFDSAGLLTARTDFNGNTTTYAYTDADGDTLVDELATITDPFSRVATFTYTAGLLSSVTDHAGRVTVVDHDASDRLIEITAPDPDGSGALLAPVTTYAYTGDRLTSISNPLNQTTQLVYDFAGRLEQAIYADATDREFISYQSRGLVDTSVEGSQADPADLFFPDGFMGTTMDENGKQVSFKLDRFGLVTSYKDELSNTTTYQRDAHGRVTQMNQPLGPVTKWEYDSAGNVTKITYPDQTFVTMVYDTSLNRVTSSTDELNRTTAYSYDSAGNVLTVTDELGRVSTYTYTSRGQVETITLADPDDSGPLAAPVYTLAYDTLGRLETITNADSTTREFTYDSADNVASVTDELGRTTAYDWDDLDRLIEVTAPDPDGTGPLLAPVTLLAYNALGLMTKQTDAAGNETTYGYNNRNRLTSITAADPDGAGPLTAPVTSYGYDSKGRVTSITDPLGKATTYAYSDTGWLTSVTLPDPDGAGSLAAPETTYSHDNLGRVITETGLNGQSTSFSYDARSRLKTRTGPTVAGSPKTTWTYDAAGQLASVEDPLGRVTSYAWDDVGNLTSLTRPDPDDTGPLSAPVIAFSYDDLDRLLTQTDPLGNVTSFEYDVMDRLVERTDADPDGAGPQSSPVTSWVWDAAGQLTAATDALGRVTAYSYDDLGRVIQITQPDPDTGDSNPAPVYAYEYDILNNVTKTTDPLGNFTTYAYDNLSRLTSVTLPDPDGAGSQTSPVYGYAYDTAGRLTSTTDPLNRVTSYEYDHIGRRTKVVLPDPDGAGSRDDQFVVIKVLSESPAERAGIEAGDVLKEINGRNAADLTAFQQKQLLSREGSEVQLVVKRGEEEHALRLYLRDAATDGGND